MARRYTGSYVPQAGATPLPRVNYWGIWNEPNEGAWLNPQWRTVGHGGRVLIAPLLYRQLVDAAYGALRATGHAHDTILIGETASRGWIYPIQFVRRALLREFAQPAAARHRGDEPRLPAVGQPLAVRVRSIRACSRASTRITRTRSTPRRIESSRRA